jgi:glycosyltransferase involved in cell wall biosynthesis
MESQKIALFSWETLHSICVGGMARAVSELSEALAKKGHEVHIFTQRGENQSDYNRIDGVNYHRCSFDPTGDILWHCEKMCNAMVERFYATERIEGKFDVIHVHDWHTINAANHLKLRSSYPFVITFHSTEWGRNGGSFGEWYEFREISGREWYGTYASDRIITVSQTMKNELMWLYKTPDQKIDVIPNGIFSKRYEMNIDPGSIKERYGIHPLAPVILFIGRLAQQKGPDILMGAIPGVLKNRWDAKFIIAGDGGMRGHLEYLSHLFDVSKAIRILGYVPQKEYLELLNACDVVCIPSRNEPFGLVLLEAWSAKKAVVASDVGGLSENIENFKNGIKVHPTSDSLSWGINYIINDPYGVRKLGEEGYKSVQKKFRWNVIAGQTVDCYKKVLQS